MTLLFLILDIVNMNYQKTVSFSGNPRKAFEIAQNTFLPHGFQIANSSESILEVLGPGTLWTKGQDPMVGVSKACISAADGSISIKAELGGVTKAIKYLILFILGMAIFFILMFGFLFTVKQGQPINKTILMSIAPLIPWPVIIPLMAIWMKSRTCKALDTLMNNMIALAS